MIYQTAIVLILFYVVLIYAGEDLYNVLGVDRSATIQEIKKAYKNLAREYHPDKNSAPDASDVFMKINGAYEILGDVAKRKEYDQFGHVHVQSAHPHHARREGFEAFHDFFGGFSNFQFHFGGESFNKYHIDYRSYRLNIKEESFKRPYLVFVTGHMCVPCMQLEPLWERIIADMETIGLGIGTYNIAEGQRLNDELKTYHYPQFIGIVQGRPTYYKGDYSLQGLRDFVRGFFPYNLVQKVNDDTYQNFLSSWKDNKVRTILFGHQDTMPLRYLAAAYEYRDRVQAAYVRLGDLSRGMELTYQLQTYRETMMVFGEDILSPMATATMERVTRATMNDLIAANKYLVLPRLSAPQVFTELCPIEASTSLRKLCLVLVTSQQAANHEPALTTFRGHAKHFSAAKRQHRKSVQFAYIYTDTQADFMEKLALRKRPQNDSVLQVAILWRSSSKTLSFEWLRDGWSVNSDDVIISQRQLDATVEDLLHHKKVLTHTVTLPQLSDEHAQMILIRMWNKIVDWWEKLSDKFIFYDQRTVCYILLTCIFVFVAGYMVQALLAVEQETVHNKTNSRRPYDKNKHQTSDSLPRDNNTVFIRELKPGNFESMFTNADPGTMTILILVHADSKTKLLQQFGKIIWPYSQHRALTFAYLMVEEQISWFRQLLEDSLLSCSLDSINPSNVIGTVLAVNGHRRYFCMYHAKHPQRKTTKKKKLVDFVGLEDESADEFDDMATDTHPIFHEDLLAHLPNWFDRLYEGSLRRIKVDDWPLMF